MARFSSLSGLTIFVLLTSACQASLIRGAPPPNRVDCNGTIGWSAEVYTAGSIDYTTFWIVFESETIQDYFKDLRVDVTLDDRSVTNEMKFRGTPEPYSGICNGDNQQIEGLRAEYTLFLPPLSNGQHTIAWKYTIYADMADSMLDEAHGVTGEYVITFKAE